MIRNFLHPEYALYQPTFFDFDPNTGECSKITKKEVNRTEHTRNAQRYIRKSIEALERYQLKDNRRISAALGEKATNMLKSVIEELSKKEEEKARKTLGKVFEIMADEALEEFLSG